MQTYISSKNRKLYNESQITDLMVRDIQNGKIKFQDCLRTLKTGSFGLADEIAERITTAVGRHLRDDDYSVAFGVATTTPDGTGLPCASPEGIPSEEEVVEMFAQAPKAAPFTKDILERATTFLASFITPKMVDAANVYLLSLNNKLRKMTGKDIAAITVVHCLSVKENEGDSPYDRVTSCNLEEFELAKYDNRHVRVALMLLTKLDLTKELAPASKGQCRKYSVAERLMEAVFPTHT